MTANNINNGGPSHDAANPEATQEYLTVFISGALDFPDTVERAERLNWASKSISQQINDHAAMGWQVLDLNWLSDVDLMVTFWRARPPADS